MIVLSGLLISGYVFATVEGAGGFAGSINNPFQKDPTEFEEVIVTAEKRGESLQDVSIAVIDLTESAIEETWDFVDLTPDVPGVTVAKNEGYKTVISIRGVGNEANQNAIAAPSDAYHVDGEFIASPSSLQTDFVDIERIEVLRGPHGLLFGGNSTAGTINIVTKQPSLEESARSSAGNIGMRSDYIWRGMTQSPDASVSGGLDMGTDSGFYSRTWGAKRSFTGDDNLYVRLKFGENSNQWTWGAENSNQWQPNIRKIWYASPIGDNVFVFVGPKIENYYMYRTPSIYKRGALKSFNIKNMEDDHMWYIDMTKGFRPGGSNLNYMPPRTFGSSIKNDF